MSKGTNFGTLGIFLITFFLIWVFFIQGPEGDISDFSILFVGLSNDLFLIALFLILLSILMFVNRDFFLKITLIFLSIFRVLNTCGYCVPLRGEESPYLVNGSCSKCKTHICSVCFKFVTKKKPNSVGCPKCGSVKFVPNELLAYPFHVPSLIQRNFDRIQKSQTKQKDVRNA